jgi:hypothetical protein
VGDNLSMKLLRIHFERFRQFIDERLEVDPRVTAIVGRNDTGKTGVIGHFFHQRVYENVVAGGDRPRVRDFQNIPTQYSLTWTIDPEDYVHFHFPQEFGPPAQHVLITSFQESAADGKHWTYLLDGQELDAYQGTSQAGTAFRKMGFEWRHVLPVPRYINPERPLQSTFEMRLFDYPDDPGEFIRRNISVEARLLIRRYQGRNARVGWTRSALDSPNRGTLFPRSRTNRAGTSHSFHKSDRGVKNLVARSS